MSTAITPQPSTPPWLLDPSARWVSVREFSVLYRRSQRRIQQMLRNGDIIVFGVATYQDAQGRWWLRIPS
jgi:hypothetical protein